MSKSHKISSVSAASASNSSSNHTRSPRNRKKSHHHGEKFEKFMISDTLTGKYTKTNVLQTRSETCCNPNSLVHATHVKKGHDLDINFACISCPSIPTRSVRARFGLHDSLLLSDTTKIKQSVNHLNYLVLAAELKLDKMTQESILQSEDPKELFCSKLSTEHVIQWRKLEFEIVAKVVNFIYDRCKHFEEALEACKGQPIVYVNKNNEWGLGEDHDGQNLYGLILEQIWAKRCANVVLFQESLVIFGDGHSLEISPSQFGRFGLEEQSLASIETGLSFIRLSSATHTLVLIAGNMDIGGKMSAKKISRKIIEIGMEAKKKFPWVRTVVMSPLPCKDNAMKAVEVCKELRKAEFLGEFSGLIELADLTERLMVGNKPRKSAFKKDLIALSQSGSDEIIAYLTECMNVK